MKYKLSFLKELPSEQAYNEVKDNLPYETEIDGGYTDGGVCINCTTWIIPDASETIIDALKRYFKDTMEDIETWTLHNDNGDIIAIDGDINF